jgi:hypothetical protein
MADHRRARRTGMGLLDPVKGFRVTFATSFTKVVTAV